MDIYNFCHLKNWLLIDFFDFKVLKLELLLAFSTTLCIKYLVFDWIIQMFLSLYCFICTFPFDLFVSLLASLSMTFLFSHPLCLLAEKSYLLPTWVNLFLGWIVFIWINTHNWFKSLLGSLSKCECFQAQRLRLRIRNQMMVKLIFRSNVYPSAWESLRKTSFPLWRLH